MKHVSMGAAFMLVIALAVPVYAGSNLNGNGLPSGAHYNLNILGKDHCPGDDLKGTNRHTIMVKLNFSDINPNNIVGDNPGNITALDKTNKIFLYPGDFAVLDGNACDGDGAAFQLPNNSLPGLDGILGTADDVLGAVYEVFARELGKPMTPGTNSFITTCGISAGLDGIVGTNPVTLTNDDEIVCSSENVILFRDKGKPRAQNVTMELTTMVVQDLSGGTTRIGIFDPLLYQYFWDYDNNGLRLVQLRFYRLN
ncbi:MAG: hypothetical protein DMD94_26250 [Candidatus Rokuibacteriota bacterium]|nr:MAG: hypothetical protein DMD94_26250 [Candidatus Rokubacteria bacterium]